MQALRIVRVDRDNARTEMSLGQASAWIANYLTGKHEGREWTATRDEVKDGLATGREYRTAFATYRRRERGVQLETNRAMAGSAHGESATVEVLSPRGSYAEAG